MRKNTKRHVVKRSQTGSIRNCGDDLAPPSRARRNLTSAELKTISFIATLILAALFIVFRIEFTAAWAFLGTAAGFAMGVQH